MGTTTMGPDFVKELVPFMFKAFADATAHAYVMMWGYLLVFLKTNWVAVLIVLVLVFIFALARAILTRRWGLFGSVLYNYFYFGTLFIIGLIWGGAVFANDYFDIVLAILYVVCFTLVGLILTKSGLKGRYR